MMHYIRVILSLGIVVARSQVRANANETEYSFNWMLSLYNPYNLDNFTEDGANMSRSCAKHMNEYLNGLHQEQLWAAKLMDASGRYTPNFFYGNNFWLGSMSICRNLASAHEREGSPQFKVRFSVARLLVKMKNFTPPQGHLILLGLCLPDSCSGQDITHILNNGYNSTSSNIKASVSVLRVRSVPGDYRLIKDKKFLALGGSILVIMVLMVVGSLYECILRRKERDISSNSAKTESRSEDTICDVENNNMSGNGSFECIGKPNVYEVNKIGRDEKEADGNGNRAVDAKENTKRTPKGVLSEVLLSFSMMSNGSKILSCSKTSEDSLNSVHGLRFLSLAWVIMVHTYLQIFAIGGNKALRADTEKMFMYQTVGNATYSVDSFFLISGLLVSYLFFKNMGEQKSSITHGVGQITAKFATLILYRFIRLTPVYIMVLGLVHLTMTTLKSASVFETPLLVDLNCDNFWWRNILYINNLFPRKEMCMLWSWYMAADTQFFVLCSFLLLLTKRFFKFSAAVMFILLVCSWCTTAFISYVNKYKVKVQEPFALFDELYDKPWTRIGPYIIGICAGWYLQKCNCKMKLPTIVVIMGWTMSLACLFSLVYGIQWGLGIILSSVYASLGHTAWGLSLAWIVVACSSGYGGWVNSLLSCRAFYPLSRLTYCAYLVHPVIMFLTNYVMDGPFHMHNGVVTIMFLGNAVASFMLSFLLSLAFEAPFVRLLKLVLSHGRKR